MEFFETKPAPNKGLNSVQKVVVDRIMGGPLTPYFLQLDVQNFIKMRNLKKMQKNRKMPKISKFRFFGAGSPKKSRFRDFRTFHRFLMYIYTITQNRCFWADFALCISGFFPDTKGENCPKPEFAILEQILQILRGPENA